ncbi:PREDICTED: disease resistance protein TAO1-like isoform X2 [Camelina sativa]|uniref:ADP-ribosyl cyclase/cyclic ADP-ribose hydrolase n=1 Tax=Camelina sativa TaxID=90675 RepID=A0ABM1Q8W4_CAMSA|nr:PREDICTED: disease resistance protein TAO1-like isoform X2 [Camelina sativa]
MGSSFLLGSGVAALGILIYIGNRILAVDKKRKEMAASLSPSSGPPSVSRTLTHQVFLSFHGVDVRKNLLTHILGEFQRKGITPFIDNKMERGVSIGSELLRAIKHARITIVIFSRNYASSSWCLNELVEVMKCKDELGQKVMTIFHQVKPADVRHHRGDFGKAFKKTCVGKSEEVKRLWRKALSDAANIHGDGVESDKWKSEADMIATIAIDVLGELQTTPSRDFDDYVGLQAHMTSIYSLLCLHTDEVRMIGIWGPSGIGKTTISRVLLNELSLHQFKLTARIGDIKRRHLNRHDVYDAKIELQKELFCKLLKHEIIDISHLGVTKERFKDKKVLVILDDVNELWQLEATVNCPGWFGSGSRIIITTEDKRVLEKHGIKDEDIYKVTKLASNLPLALQVMGSHFKQMSKEVWKMELENLKKSRLHKDIMDILKFSYDALNVEEKDLFNDIACFFNGEMINRVEEIIGDGFSRRLRVLEEKSLVYTYGGMVEMHTLLAKLVREEVQGCTVVVDAQRICNALAYNKDTLPIRGINLNLSEIRHELEIDETAFERMLSLEYLKIYNEVSVKTKLHLRQGLKFLPYKLKLLHWDRFPMRAMPSKFHPEFLVKLDMKQSKLEKLWEGNPPLGSLKEINLAGSMNLKEIPNLSNASSLKRLELDFCESLVEIPSSIGNATNLNIMYLTACLSLVKLPFSVGKLHKLETLRMIGCSNLEAFPTNINLNSLSDLTVTASKLKRFPEISTNIRKIVLSATEIEEVPSSIMYWSSLQKLDMHRCFSLKVFPLVPDSIEELDLSFTGIEEVPLSTMHLSRLRTLDMSSCNSLKVFPPVPDSIEELDLSFTDIEEVPPSIQNLSRLTKLDMVGSNLKVLPTNINMESLSKLDLSQCTGLQTFPDFSTSIEYLNLRDTAIEEVPSYIWSRFRLLELNMNDCKSLKVFPPFSNSVQGLELRCKEQFPRLLQLHLSGCKNLLSLPQLPDSISILNAANCESLERIHGSFKNPQISLNFANCFNLSQEARELIEISDCKFKLLPGEELPARFDHQAKGYFLTVKLDQRPLPLFLRFKACLLLLHGCFYDETFSYDSDVDFFTGAKAFSCRVLYIQNDNVIGSELRKYDLPALLGSKEHLYFCESSIPLNFPETDHVNHIELEFQFKVSGKYWKIQRCGVYDDKSADSR